MKLQKFFTLSSLLVAHPPLNTQYAYELKFPFVGRQSICLDILTKSKASIQLEGIINFTDDINYIMNSTGHFQFLLSKPLSNLLNKYRCSISNARLENGNAIIRITVQPIHFSRDVTLLPM